MTVEQVKANIAAGYSLTYIFSILGIVLLVRNLPGMFGIDAVAAAKESERTYGAKGHALPGTSAAFEIGMPTLDVRVFQLANDAFVGRPAHDVFERLKTPVLRITRKDVTVSLHGNPRLEKGDLLTVGGRIAALLDDASSLGPEVANELTNALGQAVRPTNTTDIITLGLGVGTGYLVGLLTVPVAGIPIGLGTMGGIVIAGMVVSVLRAINPALGGPMPEGARAFLESIGVDLFVTTLGLTVAPALVLALAQGRNTVIVILVGIFCAVVPTFISWLVGLYVLKMDPMVLAGAVSGARNSTTAMRAISDKSKSTIPSFGYPVPYALSTVVFLIYGYVAMLLS